MAVEAANQTVAAQCPKFTTAGFRLRNVDFKKAMRLVEDDSGNEVILNMQVDDAQSWSRFEISSIEPGTNTWINHCSGLIRPLKSTESSEGMTLDFLIVSCASS